MKNIKKIVRSDAAFEILDNSNCAGTDWGAGGCAILAQALNRLKGYPIVVIYNLDYEGPEHFGVITPSGTILDHDGEHKDSKAWLNFFVNNEHPREGALTVQYYTPDMDLNGIKFDSEASDKLAELIGKYKMIRETVRSVLREDFLISESNLRIDEALSFINNNFLLENDEPSPTFEWDIIKDKIDDSKRYVRTKEQAYEYLIRILDKIKSLPKSIKIRIAKYIALSLVGILGYSAISDAVYEKAPDIANSFKKEVVAKKEIAPRASSDKLRQMLRQEEGSIQEKGEPVLSAYKLGDGMITVGWGHAERIGDSQFAPGQKITREKAEQLLASDVADAESGLNQILDEWDAEGIKVKITQPMYDAMASMIFNMGIGNFRKSDFIQLVKQGRYDEAAERILTTNVTYPGHVIRRQRESDLFSRDLTNNVIAQLRENSIREIAMRLKDLPDSTALFVREINQGYDLVLYDPKTKGIYGTITVAQRDYYGPNYFVTGVAAERGFGPFIYELAMMRLSKNGKGLMPTRDGDVRDVAFNVWKQFFNRPDIKKETMTIDNPYYRFDILGFAKDDFDSDEEIQEMLSELKDYQIEALKIFNTIYSTDMDNQYSELINKADVYSKNGFDIQVAIDKADEFWNNAYMS